MARVPPSFRVPSAAELRNLDGRPFDHGSYNRFKKVHFDEGEAHGREEARVAIHKVIAKPLRELRKWKAIHCERGCDCLVCEAIHAIDAATKKPRKRP